MVHTLSLFDPAGVAALNREIDRMLRHPLGAIATGPRRVSVPVDLRESSDEYTLRVELPGVSPEQIEVSVEGDLLRISGERSDQSDEKDGEIIRRELASGRFERTIRLPEQVDSESIQASARDGVVTIKLPKAEAARPRRVTVTPA